MYKTDFYITQPAPKNSGKECTFKKVSGWGELLEAPGGYLIEIRLDKRTEGWRISEEKTGLLISPNAYKTRAAALDSLTPDFLRKLTAELEKPFAVHIARLLTDFIMEQ